MCFKYFIKVLRKAIRFHNLSAFAFCWPQMSDLFFFIIISFLPIFVYGKGFCLSKNHTIPKSTRASGGTPASSLVIRRLVFMKARESSSERGTLVFSCSGTIISNRNILTAAHCVSSRGGHINSIKICANRKYKRDCQWKYRLDKCIVPRQYRYHSDDRHDIAVCRLTSHIERNEASHMRLLTSSKGNRFDHSRVFFSGAGPVSLTDCRRFNKNQYFNTLQVHLLTYGHRKKSIEFSNGKVIRGSAQKRGFSKCGAEDGDSGGPLYVLIDDVPYLFGVVSSSTTNGYRRDKTTYFSNAYSVRYDIGQFVYKNVVSNKWRSINFDAK